MRLVGITVADKIVVLVDVQYRLDGVLLAHGISAARVFRHQVTTEDVVLSGPTIPQIEANAVNVSSKVTPDLKKYQDG